MASPTTEDVRHLAAAGQKRAGKLDALKKVSSHRVFSDRYEQAKILTIVGFEIYEDLVSALIDARESDAAGPVQALTVDDELLQTLQDVARTDRPGDVELATRLRELAVLQAQTRQVMIQNEESLIASQERASQWLMSVHASLHDALLTIYKVGDAERLKRVVAALLKAFIPNLPYVGKAIELALAVWEAIMLGGDPAKERAQAGSQELIDLDAYATAMSGWCLVTQLTINRLKSNTWTEATAAWNETEVQEAGAQVVDRF